MSSVLAMTKSNSLEDDPRVVAWLARTMADSPPLTADQRRVLMSLLRDSHERHLAKRGDHAD